MSYPVADVKRAKSPSSQRLQVTALKDLLEQGRALPGIRHLSKATKILS